MAEKKIDGVIEAVRYAPDGKLKMARAYLRRGAIWSDRVLLTRDELLEQMKLGKNFVVGQRVQYMAGTFETAQAVQVKGAAGQEVLYTSQSQDNRDNLEGSPLF
jgi:hypothetical protein